MKVKIQDINFFLFMLLLKYEQDEMPYKSLLCASSKKYEQAKSFGFFNRKYCNLVFICLSHTYNRHVLRIHLTLYLYKTTPVLVWHIFSGENLKPLTSAALAFPHTQIPPDLHLQQIKLVSLVSWLNK